MLTTTTSAIATSFSHSPMTTKRVGFIEKLRNIKIFNFHRLSEPTMTIGMKASSRISDHYGTKSTEHLIEKIGEKVILDTTQKSSERLMENVVRRKTTFYFQVRFSCTKSFRTFQW